MVLDVKVGRFKSGKIIFSLLPLAVDFRDGVAGAMKAEEGFKVFDFLGKGADDKVIFDLGGRFNFSARPFFPIVGDQAYFLIKFQPECFVFSVRDISDYHLDFVLSIHLRTGANYPKTVFEGVIKPTNVTDIEEGNCRGNFF